MTFDLFLIFILSIMFAKVAIGIQLFIYLVPMEKIE